MRHTRIVRGVVLFLAIAMIASFLIGALYPLFF